MISHELNQALLELRARILARLLSKRIEVSKDTVADALQRDGLEQVYESFSTIRPATRGPFALLRSVFFRR